MTQVTARTTLAAGIFAAIAGVAAITLATPVAATAVAAGAASAQLPAGFPAIWQDSQFDWDISPTSDDGLQLVNGFTATGEYARISVQCSHQELPNRARLEEAGMAPGANADNFITKHELARPMPYYGDPVQLQQIAASLLPECH